MAQGSGRPEVSPPISGRRSPGKAHGGEGTQVMGIVVNSGTCMPVVVGFARRAADELTKAKHQVESTLSKYLISASTLSPSTMVSAIFSRKTWR